MARIPSEVEHAHVWRISGIGPQRCGLVQPPKDGIGLLTSAKTLFLIRLDNLSRNPVGLPPPGLYSTANQHLDTQRHLAMQRAATVKCALELVSYDFTSFKRVPFLEQGEALCTVFELECANC